jgi:hypothetical protein
VRKLKRILQQINGQYFNMEEFFVIFSNTDQWYSFLLKKNFGHCSLVKKIDTDTFILIDPFVNYVGCYLVNKKFISEHLQQSKMLYLKKELDKTKKKANFWFTPRTCVSVVKGFLGESSASNFTPYSLYRHLRKQGALTLN